MINWTKKYDKDPKNVIDFDANCDSKQMTIGQHAEILDRKKEKLMNGQTI